MIFKNQQQLDKFLLMKCKSATDGVYFKVCGIIDKCMERFYSQFTPSAYIRTNELMKSCVKKEVKKEGNGFVGEVYFDAKLMTHKLGYLETQKSYMGYATWSEEKILDVALTGGENNKPHGGYAEGSPIWNTSQAMINSLGGIYKMLEMELLRIGVPIIK